MRVRSLAVAAAALLALVVVPAGPPAAAATPDRWGFAAVWNPAVPAWTTLDTTRQWGSWKAALPAAWATGGKIGTGRFQVRFPAVGFGSRGNVHVTAVGRAGNYCETVRWFQSGVDEIVEVQCHRPGGAPADTPFTVLWSVSSAGPVPGGYATVQATAGGLIAQSYNSAGAGVVVSPGGPGQYTVRFLGVAAGVLAGNLQVTALHTGGVARRCAVATWSVVGADVSLLVFCVDAAGLLTNTEFTASYHRERAVFGGFAPPKYLGYVWSAGAGQTNFNGIGGFGVNSITATAPPGRYTVRYPQLGIRETHAQVTASGVGTAYCGLTLPWTYAGPDALLDVICFDNTGNPTPHQYFASFTSRV